MFPDFHYLFQSLFGIDIPGLAIVKTFGFFVAMGFLFGAWVISKELQRKKEQGLFQPEIITEEIGKPATSSELIGMGILGFLLGFKLIGMFLNSAAVGHDPMGFILSMKGSWITGIVLAAVFVYWKYSSKKKQQLPQPKQQRVAVYPHHRVADIIFIAAIGGFAGAKIFNAFETWQDFIADPIGNLFSASGLTFYGGLIVATIALYLYARKKKFDFRHLCDAAAPALILAYGIGRLGCQTAGDGDWGIFNSAYTTQPDGSMVKSSYQDYQAMVTKYPNQFMDRNLNQITPNKYASGPSWLPDWIFAQNFKHNVNNDGIKIAGDEGEYNHVLPAGVFPTSLYEAVACILLFFVMWRVRKRFGRPLQMFGLYLIIAGIERFLIELMRVNYKYNWGFLHPTQAEIISTCLVIAGLGLLFFYKPKEKTETV
ncbi:diacylglyceryl transferase [Taibaiella lutea]|uniref:Diacylglyceryl transferase n=1 Tax=Taibaiella lutea TaxID=2608001 RepID=A0A5M6CDD2_9BACT|nr:prolipoprotein diacylglyceryl transferase family protein [Taibaiella lutea]KAA5533126.1 diacylglyceryl transferase [Taibaiella lutea]